MKKFVYFVILIMILSLCPVAHAENPVISSVNTFIAEHGSDPDKIGKTRYCADMKGGGTFNLLTEGESIHCWIEASQSDGEDFYKYEFALIFKAPFDGDYEWGCFIEDENGINTANGKIAKTADVNSELVSDEYDGDSYLYKSFMQNAQNFRDALILAIANDLNYYFDKNLDYFGINPQFFCVDGHSFGEWVYQKNATKEKNGTEKRQCYDCYATEEREVEGTMIEVPDDTVAEAPAQTPETTPEVKPEQKPEAVPEAKPEDAPDIMPETAVPDVIPETSTEAEDGASDLDEEKEPAKKLPAYAIPLGIALAVTVAAVAVFLVIKAKRNQKEDDDEDLFGM